MKVELNEGFERALGLMEGSGKNVFVTGRAGTGKSTLLTYFRERTKKKVVVLAPTGVAALNVRGQTIHSFFKFKPDVTLEGVKADGWGDRSVLFKELEMIVIDEVSMVRADLLDCVEKSLRLNRKNSRPFGGVQMVFIGDLYQLPPVVSGSEREIFGTHYASPYFFDAHCLEGLELEMVELEKIYRQRDDVFIELLNAVRNNSATEEHLAVINGRCEGRDARFCVSTKEGGGLALHLTTTNLLADGINEEHLGRLEGREFVYEARVSGEFDRRALPTDEVLRVRVGARVMMVNNDSGRRWVNGSIGRVVGVEPASDDSYEEKRPAYVEGFGKVGEGDIYFDGNGGGGGEVLVVELEGGEVVEVGPYTWELFGFVYDRESKSLGSRTVGTFTQYPLRLAWAVTIHKSQGKTFERVVIDLGRGTFVHGQLYVALSRCTSLEGIVLKQRVEKRHILMDWRVVRFMTGFAYRRSEEALPLERKVELLERAVREGRAVEMVYLKANDEKSRRVFRPGRVGEMEFKGKKFLGVSGFDEKSGEVRVFRVDRVLEMGEVNKSK